jgi:dTDP-glucose 4,6-dehydratase
MMKKLLITGGAGFIGCHVIEYFLENTDYQIISLDRLDFSGNINRLAAFSNRPNIKNRLRVLYHDLRAEINMQMIGDIGDVNIIFHIAAASHVTRSIQRPTEFIENNVIGTMNLLEYARKLPNLERMIYFSTDEVFGPAISGIKFKEHDRYNATNPYSASKAAAEELCVAYENTYKLPIYITHTMNVYGEKQNTEKFIPMTIKKIISSKILNIHYNAATNVIGSRCYLYASDVADALFFLLNLEKVPYPSIMSGKCHKFNIASPEEVNNLDIALSLADGLDIKPIIEMVDPNIDRPGHDFSYQISNDYMSSLGWYPKHDVKTKLPLVAAWYNKNREWLN